MGGSSEEKCILALPRGMNLPARGRREKEHVGPLALQNSHGYATSSNSCRNICCCRGDGDILPPTRELGILPCHPKGPKFPAFHGTGGQGQSGEGPPKGTHADSHMVR